MRHQRLRTIKLALASKPATIGKKRTANPVDVWQDRNKIAQSSELYRAPCDAFVANFIGETNLLPAATVNVNAERARVRLIGTECEMLLANQNCTTGEPNVFIGIRPEHMSVAVGPESVPAKVLQTAFGGATTTVVINIAGTEAKMVLPADDECPRVGDDLPIRLDPERCRLYARA